MMQVLGQDVRFNEFMSDNESSISDEDGDYSDWIEIYNNSSLTINLLDYRFSDKQGDPNKWRFPEISIKPYDYLVIFASGKDRLDTNELHTNFKISADGEALYLSDNTGLLFDQTDVVSLADDEVYAAIPDGSDHWIKSQLATPGSTNGLLDQLSFSSPEGFYTSPIHLSVTSSKDDEIYYTMDGGIPDTGSILYTGPLFLTNRDNEPNVFAEIPSTPEQSLIENIAWQSPGEPVDKANILRFASFRNGIRMSDIYTRTYFVDSTIFNKYDMPVISLVTDSVNFFDSDIGLYLPGSSFDITNPRYTGNYFMRGIEWERPVHIEYFENNGHLGFAQDAGIRIHGGFSRQAAQKSLRLYARLEYGKKYFDYRLMPQKVNAQYKRFILRTTMGSWGNTLLEDVLSYDLAKDLDLEFQGYRPVVVYLNGEYWGIHTLRDRIDERYIAYTYPYDKDSIDIINGDYTEVDAGSNEHYIALAEFIESNDLSLESNYEYVSTQIDVYNFIDYVIAEMFFANIDWPLNNQKLWRPQRADGKWRWIFYDIDAGFFRYNANMFEDFIDKDVNLHWTQKSIATFLIQNLLLNEGFTQEFINRYAEILNKYFDQLLMYNKKNMVQGLYQEEIPHHISRWNYPASIDEWKSDVNKYLLNFIRERPCIVEEHLLDYFQLSEFGYSCNVSSYDQGNVILAPNPCNGNFFLYNNTSEDIEANMLIADISGKIVYTREDVSLKTYEQKYFNLDGLAKGTYILILKNDAIYERMKLIVVN